MNITTTRKIFFFVFTAFFAFFGCTTRKSAPTVAESLQNGLSPLQIVLGFCQSYENQKDFLPTLAQDILTNAATRSALVSELKKGGVPGCVQALRADLQKRLLPENRDKEPSEGEETFFSLAILAGVPEVNLIIQEQTDSGRLSNWIDLLQKTDDKAYLQSLANWATKAALEMRRIEKAPLREPSDYGKSYADPSANSPHQSLLVWSPLLMERYLTEIGHLRIPLTASEFAHINIFFAAFPISYREVFKNQILQVIRLKIPQWILSFRREPVWVQLRLFSLMEGTGGGDIKRELIWLAKYHQDSRMRAMALATLESLAGKQNR